MTWREWTTPDEIDKSGWPRGPWDTEPDKAQWVDPTTGLDCLIHRNRMGALCGYVGLPPDHPLHGADCDTVDVKVHGGLTYSDRCQDTGDESRGICHVSEPGRPHDVWWLGFDCAHWQDRLPGLNLSGPVYRDVGYVKAEVEWLAAQLATLA